MTESTLLRASAMAVVTRLQAAGHVAFWAGGCVRDMLLGREPKDYDVATSARADDVLALFARARAVGKAFGVVRVSEAGHECEVATFRQDHGYRDGRHPDSVSFTDAQHDALRRDFTINAVFFDPIGQKVYDYVGGQEDLKRRVIRAVGNAADRFAEDHLRMLRAVRFASTLGFDLDPATAIAIRQHAPLISRISAERVRDELTRIWVESPRAGDALLRLEELGLLGVVLPEVAAMKNQAQPAAFHPEGDVLTHTVLMLNAMVAPSARLAYAVLLHDVGKPPTAREAPDRIRFDGHAAVGAEIAGGILARLRFSSDDMEAIVQCVAQHMRFMDVQRMRASKLRQLVGGPTFPLALELHRLDCLASHRDLSNYTFLVEFEQQLKDEPALPKPWISGNDIMALGVPQGPEIGKWHRKAYEAQLEKAHLDRGQLLEWLRKEIEKAGNTPASFHAPLRRVT